MIPVHDPVSALVTAMKSENVQSVMCAGRWLLDEGEITVVDERETLAEAQKRAEAVARRAKVRRSGFFWVVTRPIPGAQSSQPNFPDTPSRRAYSCRSSSRKSAS
jgi:hypothetical protein